MRRRFRPARSAAVAAPMLAGALCAAALALAAARGAGPNAGPPEVLMPASGYTPVVAPDGTVENYFTRGGPRYPDTKTPYGKQEVLRIRSRDQGRTWTPPELVVALPREQKWFDWSPHAMYDRSGNLHLFVLDMTDPGMAFWHTRRSAADGSWTRLTHVGPSGPMNNPIQLRSGRIVVPVGYFRDGALKPARASETVGAAFQPAGETGARRARRPSVPWDDPVGIWESTTFYSDDEGLSWKRSPQVLTVPVPIDYPGTHPGGCEPVVLELKDGRVWMLIRNQTGYLYEAFSSDGVSWSEPRATRFPTSDSPASVVRLPRGEIVLIWNNCVHPQPRDGAFLYTGRDALHAALSPDEGRTWIGYREVYRDPFRNEPHLEGMGDRGTSYACAAVTAEGNVLLVSGQGTNRRRFILVDPGWLRETHHEDSFSQGLANWSVFKNHGPAKAWGIARTAGAECVPHPSMPNARVLHVRRPDDKPADGAVWNFPIGRTGKVSIRIRLRNGFQGGLIALTDRFFHPDTIGMRHTTFALRIDGGGRLASGVVLAKERWYDLDLAWEVEQKAPRDRWPGTCKVSIDRREALTLPQLNRAPAGIGYLRLHSTAGTIDRAGFIVERVVADVVLPKTSASERDE
jgi:hypothetical protein